MENISYFVSSIETWEFPVCDHSAASAQLMMDVQYVLNDVTWTEVSDNVGRQPINVHY